MIPHYNMFHPFVIPFYIGVVYLFSVIICRYLKWFFDLPASDKALFCKNFFTAKTLSAIREMVSESLMHNKR